MVLYFRAIDFELIPHTDMKRILLCLALFLSLANVFGQRFVQLEKSGSLRISKFYIGDEITFRLGTEKYWYTETIQDLLIDDNIILFTHRGVKPEDISAIRSFRNRGWSRAWGLKLYVFGTAWGGFSLLGPFAGIPLTSLAWIVPATSIVTGFIIQKLFKSRTLKIGKKRRLRMMNLNFYGP